MVFATASMALALAAAAPGDTPVTLQGIGPLRVGLSLAALRSRFGATSQDGPYPDPEVDCEYFQSPAYPGVSMMVTAGAWCGSTSTIAAIARAPARASA